MRPPHIDSSEIVSTAAFQVDEAWFECDGASRTRTGDLLGAIQRRGCVRGHQGRRNARVYGPSLGIASEG